MATSSRFKTADETYTLADLVRMLKVPAKRLKKLQESGDLLGPDVIIPGGGHKGQRWTASRLNVIMARWSAAPFEQRIISAKRGIEAGTPS